MQINLKESIKKFSEDMNKYINTQDENYVEEMQQTLKDLFCVEYVLFFSFDKQQDTLTSINSKKIETLNLQNSLAHYVIKTKLPIMENHVTSNKYYNASIDNPLEYKIKSLLFFPVLKDNETIGLLQLYRGLKNKRKFVKKDEENLDVFAVCLKHMLASDTINKEKLLDLLGENKPSESKSKISQKIKNVSSHPPKQTHNDVNTLKDEIVLLQESFENQKSTLEQALREKDTLIAEKENQIATLDKEYKKFRTKYEELEHIFTEIHQLSEKYEQDIKKLQEYQKFLKLEIKTYKKELEKEKSKTTQQKTLESEKISHTIKNPCDVEKNIEFILQKVDTVLSEHEYTYMLFELFVYALSSSKGMAILEENIKKTKLMHELMDKYYFKGDLIVHNDKFYISDIVQHIQQYKQFIFSDTIDIKIDIAKQIPASLVFDAPKLQSILFHLLLDLYQFVQVEKVIYMHFSLKKKMLLIEVGGAVHQKNTIFHSMFKQNKLALHDKNRLGLRLGQKIIARLKGKIDIVYENDYYAFRLALPVQLIKM